MLIHFLSFNDCSAMQCLYPVPVVNHNANYFARMVTHVMEPLMLSITVLDTICWIIGGAFIFGAIGRYVQYRHNPGQSPIGHSLFLGALGIVLMLLPVMEKYALPGR